MALDRWPTLAGSRRVVRGPNADDLGRDAVHQQGTQVAEPGISIEDVCFSYGPELDVLQHVNLTIPEGDCIGIVGPSGCGKTTLLSILASLLEPTAGRVLWSYSEQARSRHPLAMVFQKDTLLPWLTTAENVGLCFSFGRQRISKREAASRVKDLLHLAGLEGFERKYPYQLSGGMRRRTAFLAAVAPMPQTLLLDEPFSSVDEPTRVTIHQDIFDIIKRLGMTVVLVTHDLAEAISLCDEVVIFTNRPAQLYARHRIPFGDKRAMLELRQTPDFLDLYGTLWHELSLQIKATVPAGPEGQRT